MNRRFGQDGNIVQNKGRWYGRYYQDAPDGTRVRRSVALGPVKEICKSQAKRKLRAHLEEIGINADLALPKPASRKTFGDHYVWWEQNKLALCKRSYQDRVTSTVKVHILPYFEEMPLGAIGEETVQEFVAHLNAQSLSASYIHDVVAVLRRIIGKQASDWDLTLPAIPYKEQRYFTESEMLQVIEAARAPWKALFFLLAETGMRCGEAFGLHVEDIDFGNRQIAVRRSIYRGIETTPKTRRAYRTVDVTSELCQMLQQHLGGRLTGFVFRTKSGRPLDRGNTRRVLCSILDRLGIPQAGLHAFRHGRVSVLQAKGVPTDLIRRWVGHSSLKETSRYTHFEQQFAAEEASRVGLSTLMRVNGPTESRASS